MDVAKYHQEMVPKALDPAPARKVSRSQIELASIAVYLMKLTKNR